MLSSAAHSIMNQHCQCMSVITSNCTVERQPVPPLSSLAMLPVIFISRWPTMSMNVTSLADTSIYYCVSANTAIP